jgi:hypothetical protein
MEFVYQCFKQMKVSLGKYDAYIEVNEVALRHFLKEAEGETEPALYVEKMAREVGINVRSVSKELVSFRWTYVFDSDGEVITSDSTLRFREREAIEQSLVKTGYLVHDVREAPDRPGKEFVFIATRNQI